MTFNPLTIVAGRIITRHITPPIPIRDHDWCAYRDGDEGEGRFGSGKTEREAVMDMFDKEES